jgi:gamma-glutamyltranspeptidase/glutathione hydrolase/leukotriene-C4 hydrolase
MGRYTNPVSTLVKICILWGYLYNIKFLFPIQIVRNITSEAWAADRHGRIDDARTENNASYYGANFYTPEDHGTAHVSVLAENGDAVSITSTVNL